MQPIYCGMRNPERDIAIAAMTEGGDAETVRAASMQYHLEPSTIRAIRSRVRNLRVYEMQLVRQDANVKVGTVICPKEFQQAAIATYRQFSGTFANLGCNGWVVTDGKNKITVEEIRRAIEIGVDQ